MLEQAIALHAQGRLPEAEQAYRAILAREPENARAGHMLGTLALDAGLPHAAVPILERVVMLDPRNPEFHTQLGVSYWQSGRQADALASFDRALSLDANFFAAHFQRGFALMEPDPDGALQSLDRALAVNPESAAAHNLRGMVLTHRLRLADALAAFLRARVLEPENPHAIANYGSALARAAHLHEAVVELEAAVKLRPDDAGMHYNLGEPLMGLGRLEEALACYDEAVALLPDFTQAHVNRGMVLSGLGRSEDALASFDRAIALDPGLASARIGRSDALVAAGRIDEALVYDGEIAKTPAFKGEALFHSALLLLKRGGWAEGWKLYEARRIKGNPAQTRSYPQAEWLGSEPLAGKTLYVYGEQGLGDTIFYSRYLAMAQAQGARVIFSPQDKLTGLMQGVSGAAEVLPFQTTPAQFDFHAPLGSMPLAFGTQPDTVPADIPYLRPDPARVEKWRQRIGAHGFRIGICWSGSANPGMGLGLDRSFPLRELAAIAALPGVRLISLQKDEGVKQLADLPPGMQVETLGEDFDSGADAFVDTAAAMQALDLVISCDTSVAHLAGALGRPCWVALKHAPDWRWALRDGTTPWYPGIALFRQDTPGNWASVFAPMTDKLKAQLA